MRILIYVQHLLGIGHFQRMYTIAQELIRRNCTVSLINGGLPIEHVNQDLIFQLPPIQSADLTFKTYITDKGERVTKTYQQKRAEKLIAHMDQFNPDFLLIESFPFGRTYFTGEIMPLLLKAKENKIKIACSIRDILIKRSHEKESKSVSLLNQYISNLFVHGDQDLIPLDTSFSSVSQITIPIHYTGYVSEQRQPPEITAFSKPTIIVSAGGGIAGRSLIETTIQMAQAHFQEGNYNFLIFSNHTRDQSWINTLKSNLPDYIQLCDLSPHFRSYLHHAAASISQAGYNTVCDLIQAKCPSILIPFSTETETEQKQRADHLSTHPLFTVLSPETLTPESLAQALSDLLQQKRSDHPFIIDMNGVQKTCDLILSGAKSKQPLKTDLWQALADEFTKWKTLKNRPNIWFRDDDVSKVTPAFEAMISLFSKHQTQIFAAAIPGLITGNDLKHLSQDYPNVTFWQHGYEHANHALKGQKKIELGGSWSLDKAKGFLKDGKTKLEDLFGEKFEAIMVPPWNRIDTPFLDFTASTYEAISLYQNPSPDVHFKHINCQIDLIDWANQKSFIGTERALNSLILELQKRRFNVIDREQPIGILLHHLDHTAELTDFLEKLLTSRYMS
ncbi:MAG: hypothetical protein KBE16_05830 [Alphaproteobacteria bacterium]|nr:hypothetical protein [Alphaproteobacteria bacterium]MBP9877766.1 hypothetical protein [Alphaproteobacteria bacterium]